MAPPGSAVHPTGTVPDGTVLPAPRPAADTATVPRRPDRRQRPPTEFWDYREACWCRSR